MEKNKIKYLITFFAVAVCGILWLFADKNSEEPGYGETDVFESQISAEPAADTGKQKIYIHITGAVKRPGVYTFDGKPRVIEVIEAAGGFTKDAVKSGVNQAEILEDGVQIMIESRKNQKEGSAGEGRQTGERGEDSGLLNINTATKEELMTLNGIGESKALSIISYRETNGKFKKIEDIMNITGIKTGVFDKIKDQIRV